ncbi:hypothetical protein [Sulfitobacter sp. SK011]|uniref:hypothetical protein n=1 Tax=Sulfitobacter sp. SK011 TaxID=1389004 RepID=UPI000E0B10E1|nr:hypothetical protein [Sulfitobacter sp. SK011]AXI42295.1 hypothetical protein C1J02_10350 [Sulfitobacter sp. SK011]
MYADIQNLLQKRAELLCKGQFEEVAKHYHLPFVAYHDGFPVYVRKHSEVIDALARIAAVLTSRGVVRLDVDVISMDLPKNKRFRVSGRYSQIDGRGDVVSQSDMVLYFVESPKGPIIEMVESHDCPMAEVWEPESAFA